MQQGKSENHLELMAKINPHARKACMLYAVAIASYILLILYESY